MQILNSKVTIWSTATKIVPGSTELCLATILFSSAINMSPSTQRTHLQEWSGFALLISLSILSYFIHSPWGKIEDWLWYSNCKMCVVLDFLNLNFFINNFLLINDLVMRLFPPTGDQLLQPWGRTVSDGVWVRMSTRRCLKVAGVGLWPWPSLWWRSVPTGSSRAWVSFSKISWKSLGRATVECPGSSPYLPSSLLSPVSRKHLIYYPINTMNW